MGKEIFKILKPGLFASIQDLGRYGYQRYGVSVSGAMDSYAIQIANILVGNIRDEAAIEIVISGTVIEILQDTIIALCGPDSTATINQECIPLWKSVSVKKRDILEIGQPKSGVYLYLAVQGGIDVPIVLGSKSTYRKANIGGYKGRVLQKNDIIYRREEKFDRKYINRRLPNIYIPNYQSFQTISVIIGPDQNMFTADSIETFLSNTYEVSKDSDRMGYRLQGPVLSHASKADIISDAIVAGTIQVPANGQPIVLLADRQTTGGYPRIATVIASDLHLISQLAPGNKVKFQAISLEEAHQQFIHREKFLNTIATNVLH